MSRSIHTHFSDSHCSLWVYSVHSQVHTHLHTHTFQNIYLLNINHFTSLSFHPHNRFTWAPPRDSPLNKRNTPLTLYNKRNTPLTLYNKRNTQCTLWNYGNTQFTLCNYRNTPFTLSDVLPDWLYRRSRSLSCLLSCTLVFSPCRTEWWVVLLFRSKDSLWSAWIVTILARVERGEREDGKMKGEMEGAGNRQIEEWKSLFSVKAERGGTLSDCENGKGLTGAGQ